MGNSGRYNHKTVYQDGYKFDSKLERDFYLELLDRKAKGLIKGFKMQVKYPLQPRFIILDGQAITDDNPDFDKIRRKNKLSINSSIDYIADFVVENAENKIIVYDTKGKATTDFRIKMKMLLFKYPDIDFKVICFDKKKKEWVDYFIYTKEQNKIKKINKAIREAKKLKKLSVEN